ncbi:hypothetical protein GOODEAATRI_002939 [Goodea atripinnis]|uniref:Uncharacterized protein n=1 Tax=Goodea atripinnis TaxID=208336 RepID=A0ABV0MQ31_9TELE
MSVSAGHVRLGVLIGFGAVVVPRTVSRSRADGTGSQQSSSRCGRILGRWWISLSMRMAQPCPDSHPAVSSTLRAAVPLLATCPSATLILAACKRRPLSRQPALSTATATLTILSTISITQHHSPREPYHFKSRAALWNAPVLCLPPVLEWLSNTITASSALLRLPSLPRKPPTHTSGSSARRISYSSLLSYSTATPPFRSLCSPWTSPSPFCPPPLHLKRSPGPAPSTGPPDPAAPYAASGAFGAKDPSARDAAEDGGSEEEDDAAPHVSIRVKDL